MSGDIHVGPNNTDWTVAIEGTGIRTPYDTLEEAVAAAAALAMMECVELLIYDFEGRICERANFRHAR